MTTIARLYTIKEIKRKKLLRATRFIRTLIAIRSVIEILLHYNAIFDFILE